MLFLFQNMYRHTCEDHGYMNKILSLKRHKCRLKTLSLQASRVLVMFPYENNLFSTLDNIKQTNDQSFLVVTITIQKILISGQIGIY